MKKLTLLLAMIFAAYFPLAAQDTFDKAQVVNKLADLMNANYVFVDKGKAMHDLLKSKLEKGAYDHIVSPSDFAYQLGDDLKSVIHDKHIRVNYDTELVAAMRERKPGGGRKMPENFGFKEVKILEGNIGYLDLRAFVDLRTARKAAKKAMSELIEADALIFDLRNNGGGSPSMIRYISSYIFGEEPVHLNDFYWRPSDSYSESWTKPSYAAVHKPDIPVYVLTSSYTFSAAEEFTYNLKNLKRATIIGETTGGGAHPGGTMMINNGFLVNIPQGRAINPVTKTNWEGIGVEPDVKTTRKEALSKALELAKLALAK